MFEYKNKFVDLVSPVVLDRVEIKNKLYAVNCSEIKKMLSCLVGYEVIDILYENNEAYMIVKKRK